MARTGCKNNNLFGTNTVSYQDPPGENFRQRTDPACAYFLSAQLLNTSDAWLRYKIKRGPVSYRQHHSYLGAANGGTNGRPGCRSELGAFPQRCLNGLDRLHHNQLDFQPSLSEKTTFSRNKKGHGSR